MMTNWWFLWMAFMFIFLVTPMGYGWGYRGWGPPYPRYIQRRHGAQAVANGTGAAFDHHSWGYGGDLLWVVVFIGALWAVSSLWMR
jgi:hypothetical protein